MSVTGACAMAAPPAGKLADAKAVSRERVAQALGIDVKTLGSKLRVLV